MTLKYESLWIFMHRNVFQGNEHKFIKTTTPPKKTNPKPHNRLQGRPYFLFLTSFKTGQIPGRCWRHCPPRAHAGSKGNCPQQSLTFRKKKKTVSTARPSRPLIHPLVGPRHPPQDSRNHYFVKRQPEDSKIQQMKANPQEWRLQLCRAQEQTAPGCWLSPAS